MTQCQMVLQYMKNFGSISPREAVAYLNCYSLAARIKNLRDSGHNIKGVTEVARNWYGKPCTFTRYFLNE